MNALTPRTCMHTGGCCHSGRRGAGLWFSVVSEDEFTGCRHVLVSVDEGVEDYVRVKPLRAHLAIVQYFNPFNLLNLLQDSWQWVPHLLSMIKNITCINTNICTYHVILLSTDSTSCRTLRASFFVPVLSLSAVSIPSTCGMPTLEHCGLPTPHTTTW